MLKPKRPRDAVAVLALAALDLWPGEGWNFVFGQANLTERVGVWSLYRNGDPELGADAYTLCLRRTLKTATHETGHMLGIAHCTAYACGMNGSNSRGGERSPTAAVLSAVCAKSLVGVRGRPRQTLRVAPRVERQTEADRGSRLLPQVPQTPGEALARATRNGTSFERNGASHRSARSTSPRKTGGYAPCRLHAKRLKLVPFRAYSVVAAGSVVGSGSVGSGSVGAGSATAVAESRYRPWATSSSPPYT